MHRTNFIAYLLALACLIILPPSFGAAQTDKVKTAMAALQAETASGIIGAYFVGDPK